MGEHLLWYVSETNDWNEALPIGNGRLGAMIFGKPDHEVIDLNEDSIWSGDYMDRDNKDSLEHLQTLRSLVLEGELDEAQGLAFSAFSGVPNKMREYQTAGKICIDTGHSNVRNYKRELQIDTAVAKIQYDALDSRYYREIFASNPEQVIVMRFTVDGPDVIDLRVNYYRDVIFDKVWAENHDTIVAESHSGISFCNMVRAKAIGGTVQTLGGHIVIKGAKEIVLYFDARSAYREKDYIGAVRTSLEETMKKEYATIYEAHILDYTKFYNRVELCIHEETSKETLLPTNERLLKVKKGAIDLGLIELYFNFGRYLLIACSREHTLPATLQGIWNDSMCPPWGSKYTININTEMNYWPAEIMNLSEMHMPLFDLLEKMHINGKKTAKEMYDCRGFVAHHNTDLWGDTAPQDYWLPGSYWVLGAAWLCLDIWEHYEYTEDQKFIERMYPILADACLFFVDFLSEDKKGRLILSPTASPENCYRHESGQIGYLSPGCTMDGQILTELFTSFKQATDLLGVENTLANTCMELLERIPKTEVHSNGTIKEWLEEYEELEPGHRHISHLFGLFPGHSISMDETKELASAAKKTLETRLSHGGGHTGWSRAWIINFWAYLYEGEKAFENINQLLVSSTLPNLFDNHPPFQIDGNFGAVAGIGHMLLQCNKNRIHILPALPNAFSSGHFSGFKAPHNIEVEAHWKQGVLEYVILDSKREQTVELIYKEEKIVVKLCVGTNRITF